MNEVFVIKNVSINDIQLIDFGIIVPPSFIIDLGSFDESLISKQLNNYLASGDIIRLVNNASVPYSQAYTTTVQVYNFDSSTINSSINQLYSQDIIINSSLGLLFNADKTFATNVSVGLALQPYATNSSVGLAIAPFATNVSVGLAIQNFATNASVNTSFTQFVRSSSTRNGLFWVGGFLDVSLATTGASISYVDGSLAQRDASITKLFNQDITINASLNLKADKVIGTSKGQLQWWDNINSKWIATSNDVLWDASNRQFQVGSLSPPSFTVDASNNIIYVERDPLPGLVPGDNLVYLAGGKSAWGNSVTAPRIRSNTPDGTPRSLSLIDTNSVIRVWRYNLANTDPAIELVGGVGDTVADPSNAWWDMYMRNVGNGTGQDYLAFRRRTTALDQPQILMNQYVINLINDVSISGRIISPYLDASLATRDSSITYLFSYNLIQDNSINLKANNASFGLYATNTSVGLAIAPFATNASVGLALGAYATNSSVNTSFAQFIRSASTRNGLFWVGGFLDVSLATTGATITYVDGSLATRDGSINKLFSQDITINASLGAYTTNASANTAFAQFVRSASTRNGLYWVGGFLDVSIATAGATIAYVDGSFARRDGSINALFNQDLTINASINTLATNASVGLALGKYVSNASLGAGFIWNGPLLDVSTNPLVYTLTSSGALTTSSTTDVSSWGVFIDNVSTGTYLLNFGTSFSHSSGAGTGFTTIYVNNSSINGSEMDWQRGGTQGNFTSTHVYAGYPIVVSAQGRVEIRWRTSGATLSSTNRYMTLLKIV